jgi:hypothetical protein
LPRGYPSDVVVKASVADWPLDEPALAPEGCVLFHAEQYASPAFPYTPFTVRTPYRWVCCRRLDSKLVACRIECLIEVSRSGGFGVQAGLVPVQREGLPVVDGRNVVPRADRMKAALVHQRRGPGRAETEAVQEPAVLHDADLEEHPVVGTRLLQVEPALLAVAAVWTEDGLPRERRRTGEGMHVDNQGVVDPVELDRGSHRRLDDSWATQDRRGMPTDAIDPVEGPDFGTAIALTLPRGCRSGGETAADDGEKGGLGRSAHGILTLTLAQAPPNSSGSVCDRLSSL